MENIESIPKLTKDLLDACVKFGLVVNGVQVIKTSIKMDRTCSVEIKIDAEMKHPA